MIGEQGESFKIRSNRKGEKCSGFTFLIQREKGEIRKRPATLNIEKKKPPI